MKKSIIFLDAAILLAVSCAFVIGLDVSFNLFKGKEKPDSPLILAANNRKTENELENIIKENSNALTHRDTQSRTPLMRLCNSNLKDSNKRREVDKYISTIIPLAVKYNADLEAKDEDGWTALMWASWSNLPTVTTALIESGADLNISDTKGNTPLSVSTYKENSDVYSILDSPLVLAILTRQPDSTLLPLMEKQDALSKRDTIGRTPLMLISNVNIEEGERLTEKDIYLAQAARLIVSKGAEVNAVDHDEKTALTYSISSNLPQVSKTLIELGSEVNHADKSGDTPLSWAAKNNLPASINVLTEAKANPNLANKKKWIPANYAASKNNISTLSLLIEAGTDTDYVIDHRSGSSIWDFLRGIFTDLDESLIDTANNSKAYKAALLLESPLMLSVITKQPEEKIQKLLVSEKDSLSAMNKQKETLLMLLTEVNLNIEDKDGYLAQIAEKFIQNGADVNAKDENDETALLWATRSNRPKLVASLIKNGADSSLANKKGTTPLISAVMNFWPAVITSLLDNGAQADLADSNKMTPLMWASSADLPEAVTILLNSKADANSKDKYGKTPLIHATKNPLSSVLPSLIQAGADISATDLEGMTALIWASKNNQSSLIDSLLDAGANIDAQDNEGRTALYWAVEGEYRHFAELLLKKGANPTISNIKGLTPIELAKKKDKENDSEKEDETLSSLFDSSVQ